MVRVPLDRVFDNPFQTRQVYAGIEELAESIVKMKAARPETSGLMQVGTGRILLGNGQGWKIIDPAEYGGVEAALNDEPEAFVQIAFAHRRLRAFRLLAETDPDYATYPVEIVVLDNNQMADLAWEENAKRKDLTAIEEAEALANAIDLFKYTQSEIGQRWGLSQSAVANKLRLLKLPKEAQQAIRDGLLSEKTARVLLTAMGKSPAVYQEAAGEILPPAPVDEIMKEKALALADKNQFWKHRVDEKTDCDACHRSLQIGDMCWKTWSGPDQVHLCENCWRIGNDWQPLSATEAEKKVDNAINRNRCNLSSKDFPLDVQVAEGADGVVSGKCVECPLYQIDGENSVCFDRGCAEIKKERWKAFLYNQLRERLVRDYKMRPEQITIFDGYTGTPLRSDSYDAEMVGQGGPCAPGRCKRLQFRYTTWDQSDGIKPYKDLPFYFYCNHTGAHSAAQRRYLESQKGDEERSEAVRAAEQAQTRKAEARKVFDNALASVRQALVSGKLEAWQAVVNNLNFKGPTDSVEAIWGQFAERLFEHRAYSFSDNSGHSWTQDDAVDEFKREVYHDLERWHIARIPQLKEIVSKIENILGFVYENRVANKITMKQIEGNRVNLEKLVQQVKDLHQSGTLNGHGDIKPIINLIQETTDELWEAAGDIGQPLPQDWGISLEMSLNELIASSGEAVR